MIVTTLHICDVQLNSRRNIRAQISRHLDAFPFDLNRHIQISEWDNFKSDVNGILDEFNKGTFFQFLCSVIILCTSPVAAGLAILGLGLGGRGQLRRRNKMGMYLVLVPLVLFQVIFSIWPRKIFKRKGKLVQELLDEKIEMIFGRYRDVQYELKTSFDYSGHKMKFNYTIHINILEDGETMEAFEQTISQPMITPTTNTDQDLEEKITLNQRGGNEKDMEASFPEQKESLNINLDVNMSKS